jgi:hypothetical protein
LHHQPQTEINQYTNLYVQTYIYTHTHTHAGARMHTQHNLNLLQK